MFPFRVDGVRDNRMQILTMNVMRVIPFGRGRSLQLRVDVVNALNDEQLLAPNLDPTSTQSAWSPTPRTPWGGGSRS